MFCFNKKDIEEFYRHMELGGKIADENDATDRDKVLWSLGFLNYAFQKISTNDKTPSNCIIRSISMNARSANMTTVRRAVLNQYKKANHNMSHSSSEHVNPGDNILHGMMLYAYSYNDDKMSQQLAKEDEDYVNYLEGAKYAVDKVRKWHRG